jgi:hypothetical protein
MRWVETWRSSAKAILTLVNEIRGNLNPGTQMNDFETLQASSPSLLAEMDAY